MEKSAASLKSLCKIRFMDDVIKDTLKASSGKGLILILDDHTSRLLDSIASMSELIASGVTAIENIERQRKAFPSFRGVYFVAPTKANVDRIESDFAKKPPLYHSQFLFASRGFSDDVFQYLASKSFSKRLSVLKEINIDLLVVGDTVFRVLQAAPIEQQADSLVSLLASVGQVSGLEIFRPKMPVFKDSGQLQRALEPKIKTLLPHIAPSSGEGTLVKLFIFERGIDLVTPLMHDFYFESIVADLLGDSIQIFKELDDESKPKTQSSELKKVEEEDKLYRKYRYEFIQEVKDGLPGELDRFKKENPTAVAQQNKQADMEIGQMQNVLRGLNEYNEFTRFYTFNLEAAKKVLQISQTEGLQALAELEQTVATAISDANEKIDAKFRAEDIKKFLSSGAKEELKLRLVLIALGTLYIDVSWLKDLLAGPSKKSFESYADLVEKFGKLVPEHLKDVYRKLVKERFDKSKSSLQRYTSRAEYLVSRCLFENAFEDLEKFSYDQGNGRQAQGKTNFGNSANTLFKGKLGTGKTVTGPTTAVVFFMGGVSYSEIGSLMRLERVPGAKLKMLVGSNAIYNPKEFIEKFVNKN